MQYFLIQSYHKEIDEKYHRHLYPCYLTSYDLNVGGKNFGLQSGTHDALKFKNEECLKPYLEKAIKTFGDKYEFDVVPFDGRIFGKAKLLYVVS